MDQRNTCSKTSYESLERISRSRGLSQIGTLPSIDLLNTDLAERFAIEKHCPINRLGELHRPVELTAVPGQQPPAPVHGNVEQESFQIATYCKVFQEEEPRGLLRVIKLPPAARLFPQYVVNILERLLKHLMLV